uniref:Uncharacterized protein n=1 Tax=Chromera velia CCMP2878 TaxID=1169474 RepID=A0A0G4GSS3_9ALVE|eukprot:Cvel_5133.t1-p1 / transcript=Cvel_5133.t1 / gene=Cvel_5133 / organism=Chromera_velia_CCMP2878 / gene_product=hypothetical protein / transcript_product=hypothetical protein / location=Cvel_scaffold235:24541-25609(-) / protein_length=181 / sequence_SO=supercontig / SO=protein_coding / is_pseudo=false
MIPWVLGGALSVSLVLYRGVGRAFRFIGLGVRRLLCFFVSLAGVRLISVQELDELKSRVSVTEKSVSELQKALAAAVKKRDELDISDHLRVSLRRCGTDEAKKIHVEFDVMGTTSERILYFPKTENDYLIEISRDIRSDVSVAELLERVKSTEGLLVVKVKLEHLSGGKRDEEGGSGEVAA